jgi:hypothetical protein
LTIDHDANGNEDTLGPLADKSTGIHRNVDRSSVSRLKHTILPKVGTQPCFDGASGHAHRCDFYRDIKRIDYNKAVFQRWTPFHDAKIVNAARHHLFTKGLGETKGRRHRQ